MFKEWLSLPSYAQLRGQFMVWSPSLYSHHGYIGDIYNVHTYS